MGCSLCKRAPKIPKQAANHVKRSLEGPPDNPKTDTSEQRQEIVRIYHKVQDALDLIYMSQMVKARSIFRQNQQHHIAFRLANLRRMLQSEGLSGEYEKYETIFLAIEILVQSKDYKQYPDLIKYLNSLHQYLEEKQSKDNRMPKEEDLDLPPQKRFRDIEDLSSLVWKVECKKGVMHILFMIKKTMDVIDAMLFDAVVPKGTGEKKVERLINAAETLCRVVLLLDDAVKMEAQDDDETPQGVLNIDITTVTKSEVYKKVKKTSQILQSLQASPEYKSFISRSSCK